MAMSVNIALLSGRCTTVRIEPDETINALQHLVVEAFQEDLGDMVHNGQILDCPNATIRESGIMSGSLVTALTNTNRIDVSIEQRKLCRVLESLNNAKGVSSRSMISLSVPASSDVKHALTRLQSEFAIASDIRLRVGRLTHLGCIAAMLQKLKLYGSTPRNGLVVYSGTILTEEGKEQNVNIDIEPYKPIHASIYICDNKFHTDHLTELLDRDDKFGFLVIDETGCLFGTVQGSHREVLDKFSAGLPMKHGRGGQSELGFSRLRLEKLKDYIQKVQRLTAQFFITDGRPNIKGLLIAVSVTFTHDVLTSELVDPRLTKVVLNIVDVAYGGDIGFDQAIGLAAEQLKNVKLVQEKKLITRFLNEVALDTGMFCFGIRDTIEGLERGIIKTLIVWEGLRIIRLRIQNPHMGTEHISHLTPDEEKSETLLWDSDARVQLRVKDRCLFVEWLMENYKQIGARVEFITDQSREGNQFVQGFGGLGGMLRYCADFEVDGFADAGSDNQDDDFESVEDANADSDDGDVAAGHKDGKA